MVPSEDAAPAVGRAFNRSGEGAPPPALGARFKNGGGAGRGHGDPGEGGVRTGETPGGDERRSWEAGGPGHGADSGRPRGKAVGAGDKGNPGKVARGRGEEAGEGTAGSDPGRQKRGARGGHRGWAGGFAQGSPPSRCWKGGIPGFSPFWRLRGPRVLVPAPVSWSPDWWKKKP